MRKNPFVILTFATLVICAVIVFLKCNHPHTAGEETDNSIVLEKTIAEIRPSTVEAEMILSQSTKLNFTLCNTGAKPLIIQHVATNCECTIVDWEKNEPIEQDSSIILSIQVTPNSTGYFSKKVFVFCNIVNSPLLIHVKGKVIQN